MKVRCDCWRCGWQGHGEEMLKAPNPFEPSENLIACPKCKQVDSLRVVCDEPGCWDFVTCGTPTDDGYRSTCSEHKPTA